MIHPELLEVLCCPETRQRLRPASSDELRLANRAAGTRSDSGPEVSAGLVREDGAVLYPIRNGIPILLLDERLEIPRAPEAPGSEEQVEQDRDPDHHPVEADAGA